MKRSEFAEIVNSVSQEELDRLSMVVQQTIQQTEKQDADSKIATMISEIVASIPATAARTTAEILLRSGVLHLEDD